MPNFAVIVCIPKKNSIYDGKGTDRAVTEGSPDTEIIGGTWNWLKNGRKNKLSRYL